MPATLQQALGESGYAAVVAAIVLAGLLIANLLYDRGTPQYISRKIGHLVGGLAFLVGVLLFSSAYWPLALSAMFTLVLYSARLLCPRTFRGVGGSGRSEHSWSEVLFSLSAVPVFAIGWLWLDQPGIALASLLFMAWGDGATGIIRSRIYHQPVKGLWGSFAMLAVCLAVAWALIKPFWIGAAAALAAVTVEWFCGDCSVVTWADDNWTVPLVSLGVVVGLMYANGSL